jgi:hypothetical protein
MTGMTRAAVVEELETATPTASPLAGRAASSAAPSDEPQQVELSATIAAIRAQARRDPQGYLARTLVPEGGE